MKGNIIIFMKMIAAVDLNWGIGSNGKLLADIPQDLKYFKKKTLNSIIIFGKKTLLTFPNAKPLENRKNIVLTKDYNFKQKDITVCHSIEELLKTLEGCTEEVFVSGGGTIYTQLLPLCDTAFITKIYKKFDADTFIENLDKNSDWFLAHEGNIIEQDDGIKFQFNRYERVK